ncbi:unnamed protein product [Medioppia subpectinata]|uniref:Male-enhanced antigen 1 n=1 Tax=Medioppia subpectinata TaxID=1979941 RepID=A0A7R9KQ30_9ACAR|nr:unnamed protein product [Medioppia subpectinata]CAG2107714.1 unnamed protein product [Medioppia subpectinata]
MPINANLNDTPTEEPDSGQVSAAEVPINHMMDGTDDSDFDDDTSEDSNDRYYELLATQEPPTATGGGSATSYYQHNYVVQWVDWDQYEDSVEQQTTDDTNQTTSQSSSDTTSQPSTHPSISHSTAESSSDGHIDLSDDRINEIKTIMTGIELPKDNIPLWAKDLPEDQWKSFIASKSHDKHN